MGSITHSITDAVGLTDYHDAKEARNNARQQADRSYSLTKEQLAFQRQQYNDWKTIYGPIQENLGNYYQHLTANSWENTNFTAIQKHFQTQVQQVHQILAQRGLDTSGIEAQSDLMSGMQAAQAKANIEANADQYIAKQKMGFLGLGLGQGTQMLGINANVSNNGASNMAQLSGTNMRVWGSMMNTNTQNTTNFMSSAMGGYAAMNAPIPGMPT